MKLHHVKIRVEYILKNYPETRDSDKLLQIKYLKHYHNISLSEEQIHSLMKAPSLESIRRNRQKLQEEGQYSASDKVKKARTRFEEIYRKEFSPKRVIHWDNATGRAYI